MALEAARWNVGFQEMGSEEFGTLITSKIFGWTDVKRLSYLIVTAELMAQLPTGRCEHLIVISNKRIL